MWASWTHLRALYGFVLLFTYLSKMLPRATTWMRVFTISMGATTAHIPMPLRPPHNMVVAIRRNESTDVSDGVVEPDAAEVDGFPASGFGFGFEFDARIGFIQRCRAS